MPFEGETIKIEFAKWTGIRTKIGIFLRFHDGNAIIDLGDRKIYLDRWSTFFIYEQLENNELISD